jgi:predicted dehydrogenase/threonine dehydrogenase-like Zn-dependent dehydrogenase
MKTLLQNLRGGPVAVVDVPAPALQPGGVLVQTAASAVSAGTERMVVDLAQSSLAGKARQRPDLVRQVIGKVKKDGIAATLRSVRSRLDDPMTLGYSSAGTVLAAGSQVRSLAVGDRVACAGGGYAVHAEVVYVPQNLVVKLPDQVDFDSAAFTTLGAVALQGLRLAAPQLGESVAVIGLGLLGQITCQLLAAAGCQVFGLDLNPRRVEMALSHGAHFASVDAVKLAELVAQQTGSLGVDAVLITAGTSSNEPVILAAEIARVQGRVVAVGAVGMDLPRRPYFDKELTFQVSRSYGPGRYDPEYEEKGRDYPAGYVRWTENRNMQAFVDQLGADRIDIKSLITHRFSMNNAPDAYKMILGSENSTYLGILIEYPQELAASNVFDSAPTVRKPQGDAIGFGLIGAGLYAKSTLLPALAKVTTLKPVAVATAGGPSAAHMSKKYGFAHAGTSAGEAIQHPEVSALIIATRHHLHAEQVIAALDAGKDVFCEKPLCLTASELDEILAAYQAASTRDPAQAPSLMVGFNRRFAPLTLKLREFLPADQARIMHYRVNAGFIPQAHWTQDPEQGGGRLLGEGCHFIDLLMHLAESPITNISAQALPDQGRYSRDNLQITLRFSNGSLGTIQYLANADSSLPKEQIQVHCGGRSALLDNFKRLVTSERGRSRTVKSPGGQDKGHQAELHAWAHALSVGGPAPISLAEIVNSTRATLLAQDSLADGQIRELR